MSRLANRSPALSEKKALRDQLLREADRHRYRLHTMPGLTRRLAEATNDLLKAEQEAQRPPAPLGDAGVVGSGSQGFDFYRK